MIKNLRPPSTQIFMARTHAFKEATTAEKMVPVSNASLLKNPANNQSEPMPEQGLRPLRKVGDVYGNYIVTTRLEATPVSNRTLLQAKRADPYTGTFLLRKNEPMPVPSGISKEYRKLLNLNVLPAGYALNKGPKKIELAFLEKLTNDNAKRIVLEFMKNSLAGSIYNPLRINLGKGDGGPEKNAQAKEAYDSALQEMLELFQRGITQGSGIQLVIDKFMASLKKIYNTAEFDINDVIRSGDIEKSIEEIQKYSFEQQKNLDANYQDPNGVASRETTDMILQNILLAVRANQPPNNSAILGAVNAPNAAAGIVINQSADATQINAAKNEATKDELKSDNANLANKPPEVSFHEYTKPLQPFAPLQESEIKEFSEYLNDIPRIQEGEDQKAYINKLTSDFIEDDLEIEQLRKAKAVLNSQLIAKESDGNPDLAGRLIITALEKVLSIKTNGKSSETNQPTEAAQPTFTPSSRPAGAVEAFPEQQKTKEQYKKIDEKSLDAIVALSRTSDKNIKSNINSIINVMQNMPIYKDEELQNMELVDLYKYKSLSLAGQTIILAVSKDAAEKAAMKKLYSARIDTINKIIQAKELQPKLTGPSPKPNQPPPPSKPKPNQPPPPSTPKPNQPPPPSKPKPAKQPVATPDRIQLPPQSAGPNITPSDTVDMIETALYKEDKDGVPISLPEKEVKKRVEQLLNTENITDIDYLKDMYKSLRQNTYYSSVAPSMVDNIDTIANVIKARIIELKGGKPLQPAAQPASQPVTQPAAQPVEVGDILTPEDRADYSHIRAEKTIKEKLSQIPAAKINELPLYDLNEVSKILNSNEEPEAKILKLNALKAKMIDTLSSSGGKFRLNAQFATSLTQPITKWEAGMNAGNIIKNAKKHIVRYNEAVSAKQSGKGRKSRKSKKGKLAITNEEYDKSTQKFMKQGREKKYTLPEELTRPSSALARGATKFSNEELNRIIQAILSDRS